MNFFPVRPQINPTIYAYKDDNPKYKGLLKVGYTTKTAQQRVEQQYSISRPIETMEIVLDESAIKEDGTTFTDHDVHRVLEKRVFFSTYQNQNIVVYALYNIKQKLF